MDKGGEPMIDEESDDTRENKVVEGEGDIIKAETVGEIEKGAAFCNQ